MTMTSDNAPFPTGMQPHPQPSLMRRKSEQERFAPKAAVRAAIGVAVLSVIITFTSVWLDVGISKKAELTAVHTHSIAFQPHESGGVMLVDAPTGKALHLLPAEQSSLLKNKLRANTRQHKMIGVDQSPPMTLRAWDDGSMTLLDPATGRIIDMRFFGSKTFAEFAKVVGKGTQQQ